jgi:hypothetical protein
MLPQQPPLLGGKPTQAPLNREEQKIAFEALKKSYTAPASAPPTPEFPLQGIRETKLTESEQLKALRSQMMERGFTGEIAKVDERLEEKKTADTIKSFYCNHQFQLVKAQFMLMPIKYKICLKCGLVK